MLRFDIRVAENLDALMLRSSDGTNDIDAVSFLRRALPGGADVRRSVEGIRVAARSAPSLLSAGVAVRWTADARRYATNRASAIAVYPRLRELMKVLREGGAAVARRTVVDNHALDVLDAHQLVNVAAMTLPDGFGICLFDEQGAGKTVSLIFAYDLLAARGEVDQVLVVAPKSMVPEWPKDFARFRPGLYRVTVVAGTSREKRAALCTASDVYVTNFETVVYMEDNFKALLRPRADRSVLVVDESFFVKSPDAKRTRALRRLREWCSHAFVLCGTPAPNAPQDLIEQFNLVDFGLAFDGVVLPPDRESALPTVRAVVEGRGLYVRHLKERVLPDLPDRSFRQLYVPMRPEQSRIYQHLRDDLVSDVRSVSESDFRRKYGTYLARRSALLQVCSNPVSVVEGYDETPAKLIVLDDLLDRWICRESEKVVLWSFYRASVDVLVSRYAHLGVVRYDGGVSEVSERGKAVRRFQEDDDIRLFVANPAAAGAGLTLHRARLAVYESMSNQAAHYLQSLDRIHRRGQGREVQYVVLLCQNTLEETEYQRLLSKQRMAGDLLGDAVSRPVTRESFLAGLSQGAPNSREDA